jgi:hypothetical protein
LAQAVERGEDRLAGVVGQKRDRLKQRGQVATHAAIARQHQLARAVIRRLGQAFHRADGVGELVAGHGREHRVANGLGDGVVEDDPARVHERAAGGVERFAVGEALPVTLRPDAEQQLAVQAVEELQGVVLAALCRGDRERHQRRCPARVVSVMLISPRPFSRWIRPHA